MSPSSLIFVVVLLIWSTYLSLHVARRRDQMSTARSVDRFSAHMRVLQRRMVRTPEEATGAPSSGNTRTSILTAGALEATEDIGGADLRPTTTDRRAGAAERRTQAARAYLGAVRSNRAFAAWGGLTGVLDQLNPRRLRAYALLTFALAGAISFVLAAMGRLGWALPLACAAGAFAMLAWLRFDRMSVVAARERSATAERSADERARALARRRADEHELELARQAAAARPEAGEFPVAQEVAPRRVRAAAEFFDRAVFDDAAQDGTPGVAAVSPAPAAVAPTVAPAATVVPAASAAPSAPVAVDPIAEDRQWRPVPVPPPTYTLKARADHPMPPAMPAPAPVPIEVEDEFDDVLWRQDAVGS